MFNTGLMKVSSSLEEEPFTNVYELNITATDLGSPPLSSQTTVQVIVDSADSKLPVIASSLHFHMSENASVGDVVGEISLENVTTEDLEFRMADQNSECDLKC